MRDSVFGMAKETTFGTAVTTPTQYPPVQTVERTMDREVVDLEETVGNAFPPHADYGYRFHTVDVTGAAHAASIGRILTAFFGAPTTTTPGGGTTSRQHLYEPVAKANAGSDHFGIVPHTLYVSNKDFTPEAKAFYSGALGNEFAMNVSTDDLYNGYTASFVAMAKDTSTAAPTVTADATRKFTFDETKVYIGIDGAAEAEVKVGGFGCTYSTGVDTDQAVLGSLDPYTLRPENRNGTITFSPRQDHRDWWHRGMQDDPARVKVRAIAEGTIIESTIRWTLEFTIHHAILSETPAVGVDASARQKLVDITARAEYSEADSAFMSVKLINTTTSY